MTFNNKPSNSCPTCGFDGVYNSGFTIECLNRTCRHFSQRHLDLHKENCSEPPILELYVTTKGNALIHVIRGYTINIVVSNKGTDYNFIEYASHQNSPRRIQDDIYQVTFMENEIINIQGECRLDVSVFDESGNKIQDLRTTYPGLGLSASSSRDTNFALSDINVSSGHNIIFSVIGCTTSGYHKFAEMYRE